MTKARLSGAMAAVVTPLRDGGERLDEEAVRPLLEFYAASGVDGVFILGTTGEGVLLGQEERRRMAELAAAHARSLRVIVHCGAQSTSETSALAAHAAEAGADAVAVISPPYFVLSETELTEHFASAAAACAPLPFYVYEFADRSGYSVPIAVIEELRGRAANLTGLKVSDTPFERVKPYLDTGLDVFVGAEGLVARGLEHGAVGAVSGVAAAFPEAIAALVRDPSPERTELADGLRAALSKSPFQASVKAALRLRGLPVRPDVRAPLRPLSPEGVAELGGSLERLVGRETLVSGPVG